MLSAYRESCATHELVTMVFPVVAPGCPPAQACLRRDDLRIQAMCEELGGSYAA